MTQAGIRGDTPAWIMQSWISFFLSVGLLGIGVLYLPVDWWMRGYLFMGMFFMLGSTLQLAKTLRDRHEYERFVNRVRDAKAEQILTKYEA